MDKEFIDALKKNSVTMTKLTVALDRLSDNLEKNGLNFDLAVDFRKGGKMEKPNRFVNVKFVHEIPREPVEVASRETVSAIFKKSPIKAMP